MRVLLLLSFLSLLWLPALAPAAAGAPPHAAPFLWEVPGPGARHFLLGSVHLLPPEAHPLPAALEAAYRETRGLVLEADLAELAAPELQARMLGAARDDHPGGLEARLGRGLYAKLQKRASALGLPAPPCAGLRAWFCALTLELLPLQQAGFTIEHGLDHHFYSRARDDGRPVAGLETAEHQVSLFTTMPEATARQLLAATLDESTYTSQSPQDLYRIWRSGDVAALEAVVRDLRQRHPAVDELLLAGRNRAWMPQLARLLRGEEPHLVVVGAAHLVGPAGLPALLRAQGFEPRPVAANPPPASRE
jgi:uncharacterized protein